jgi:hypothetical protein
MNNPTRFVVALLSIFSVSAQVTITRQPVPQEVQLGQTATFEVEATAGPGEPIIYQWYFNGRPLQGQTQPILTISSVQSTNVGTYFVRVGNFQNTRDSAAVSLLATIPASARIFPAVEVEVFTESGRTYYVERSTNLVNWSQFSTPFVGTGGAMNLLFSTRGNAHTFYRVQQRVEPQQVAAPSSLNGRTLFFTPTNPPAGNFQVGFTGIQGSLSGNYQTSGSVSDAGTYTYSLSQSTGTITFRSNLNVQAIYVLDYNAFQYTKSQNGVIIETGRFSF